MNPILKKSKKEDYKKLAEIYKIEFSKPPYNEPWTKKKAIEKIKFLEDYCDLYSVFYEKKIVGFIALNPTKFMPGKFVEGEEFCISEKFKNKGIGKFCIEYLKKIYKKKGFQELLFIVLRKSKAYKIYKRLGYLESKSEAIFVKRLK